MQRVESGRFHGNAYGERGGRGGRSSDRENGRHRQETVILCGKGNNGGDGFVAARLLAAEGAKVTVVLMQGAPASDLAKQAYDKMGRGIEIIMVPHGGAGAVDAADVIIDAVFGFSFHGRLPSVMEPLFARAAENKKAFHISVDIPSGAVCDTGAVEGACFKADLTVTFTAMKPGGRCVPGSGLRRHDRCASGGRQGGAP